MKRVLSMVLMGASFLIPNAAEGQRVRFLRLFRTLVERQMNEIEQEEERTQQMARPDGDDPVGTSQCFRRFRCSRRCGRAPAK